MNSLSIAKSQKEKKIMIVYFSVFTVICALLVCLNTVFGAVDPVAVAKSFAKQYFAIITGTVGFAWVCVVGTAFFMRMFSHNEKTVGTANRWAGIATVSFVVIMLLQVIAIYLQDAIAGIAGTQTLF